MKISKPLVMTAAITCLGVIPLAQAQDWAYDSVRTDGRADVRTDVRTDARPDERTDVRRDPVRDWAHDGLRLRCGSVGKGNISMHSRYAVRGTHRQLNFGAAFEAPADGRYMEGDLLDVLLAGIPVGTLMLEQRDGGHLIGVLELQQPSDRESRISDVDLRHIRVGEGTSVVVGPLGCALDH